MLETFPAIVVGLLLDLLNRVKLATRDPRLYSPVHPSLRYTWAPQLVCTNSFEYQPALELNLALFEAV